MSNFIIVYLEGNQPTSSEDGKAHMAKYMQWMQSLGENAVSPANPLKNTQVITSDKAVSQGSAIAMSGYTIIKADSMDEALVIAKGCPFLDIGGTIEVSEIISMPTMS